MSRASETTFNYPVRGCSPAKDRRTAKSGLAAFIAHEVVPNNPSGFTFDPREYVFPEFGTEVYIVSLDGFEYVTDPLPTLSDVRSWLKNVNHLLQRRDVYVGGWLDTKSWRFNLDVSVPILGRGRAKRIGGLTGQSTIYHPATDSVIPV